MKIQNEFTVSAPIEEAWKVMLDLERIAPCLPGAAIQGSEGDEYQGTMKVKIGPITANYKGTVKFEETDESAHRAVLQATGRDARGQGTASATIVSNLKETDGGTQVNVETDMKLTGRAAQFGRGIAQDVASKMLDQFASCLENEISGGGKDAAASAAASEDKEPETASSDGASEDSPPVTPTATGSLGKVVSSEDPTVMAGASVQGAVVSGSSPEHAPPPSATQSEPEPFDLGAAGGEAVMKRAAPFLIGAGILLLLILLLRRRR